MTGAFAALIKDGEESDSFGSRKRLKKRCQRASVTVSLLVVAFTVIFMALLFTTLTLTTFAAEVPAQAQEQELLIPVAGFKFSGHTAFTSETLSAVVDDLAGRELTLSQLEEATERITRYYREHAYLVATAFVPVQEIGDDHIVEIAVLEGKYGQVNWRNASRLKDHVAQSLLHPVAPGALIQAAPLERALRLLSETPGVKVRSALSAGSEPGATDLTVELEDAKRLSGLATLDNYGNEHTGLIRAAVSLDVNNALGTGDQLNVQAITTGRGLFHGHVGFSAPLGLSATRWNASYTSSRYEMGGPFAGLDVQGTPLNVNRENCLSTSTQRQRNERNDHSQRPCHPAPRTVFLK